MNRRELLLGAGGLIGGGIVGHLLSGGRRAEARAPNVLMISVDDLNGWIGPLAHPTARTPALDRLAERGVCFTRAYCAAPSCAPSRAAVLTGLAPTVSGCYVNADNWRDIVPDAMTLPRALRLAGYRTAGFGKLFHARKYDDPGAWDERTYRDWSPTPPAVPANGLTDYWDEAGRFDWGPLDIPVEEMDDHRQVDHALAFLDRAGGAPFFLACGIYRPHLPWYVPRRFFELYPRDEIETPLVLEDDLADVPPSGRALARTADHRAVVAEGQWKPAVQAYLASISCADYEIGRLLDGLDASGHRDDTLVVLWSDHGWHLGPKTHWRKFALWEEATRSVLLFAGPGVAAGERCERTVSLLDIYPTLAARCPIGLPPRAAGLPLERLLRDPGAAFARPVVSTFVAGNHSVRSERYRYTRYADGAEELYDHEHDPLEWTNLAGRPAAAEIIAGLRRWLPAEEAPASHALDLVGWLELPTGGRALDPAVDGTLVG